MMLAARASAQEPAQAPATVPSDQQPRIEERVEVVAVTPIHGIGLSRLKVPANVQVFTADQVRSSAAVDVPRLLADRAAGVQINEAQAGAFQPDLQFRGFAGSPLLGAAEGLAVYQDGVRINDPFGDTIQWDLLPSAAIATINLMPGSNPLFGLNAIGGALSIRTRDGFDSPGQRVSFTTGSFARHRVDVESGSHRGSLAYFVAGTLIDEAGWRDFSPATIRRLFGDLAWRGQASTASVRVTAASNDLTGNGPVPVELAERDRDAVFTHPDRTDNDGVLVTTTARRQTSDRILLEGVAHYRHSRTGTFNGDVAADDDEGDRFAAVNNISHARNHATGATGQMTRDGPLWGRDNHLIVGTGFEAASTQFDFATELARLTPERGTTRSGLFDEDAAVDLHSRVVTVSAFVTTTWSVTDALAVTASARFNRTELRLRDQLGTALDGTHRFRRINPAAGMTYQLRRWLNVYGSYGQSSRVPTPVELTCADAADPCRLPNAFVSDPPLKQIVGRTWEGGLRDTTGPLRWTVAAFTAAATDDIIFVSSGTTRGEGHFQNVARTRRRGIEASVEYEPGRRLSAFAAYTLQRATFGTDLRIASRFHPSADEGEIAVQAGDRFPGVPAHAAKLGLSAMLSDRLNVGMNLRAQSGQFLRGDEANLLSRVPGFAVVNAQARHRVTTRIAAVVHAENVFDAAYSTFGVLGDASLLLDDDTDRRFFSPGAPRAVWVGVEIRF